MGPAMELQALGAAATAGLASAAIEKPAGKAGKRHTHCTDCGSELVGRFCHTCGQPAHLHRSLLHLAEEFLHGVLHFDGRVWRTLPLLFLRPGKLTREWVHGKRTRYVSPLAMFLFSVFITFMVLSLLKAAPTPSFAQVEAKATAEVAALQSEISTDEQALAAAGPRERAVPHEKLEKAREKLANARRTVAALEKVRSAGVTDVNSGLKSLTRDPRFAISTGDKTRDEKLAHYAANPELAAYKFQNTFYKYSFLLAPLSIPFVALLFLWKRGYTLYDHGVFVLYSLTFVSIAILVTAIGGAAGTPFRGIALGLFMLVVPTHMYFQLKGAYALGAIGALWRLLVLMVFCVIVVLLFLASVVFLGFG